MSDEHNPRVLGCAGNKVVKTPHLDRLAAGGTYFADAYCNSPICVPSRASFATGHYVHTVRFWDNGMPYDGSVRGWGHRLIDTGHRSVSIGKLHYRSAADPNGFDAEIMPLHVVDGVGDLLGMLRRPAPVRTACERLARDLGPGESSYAGYDRRITQAAKDWLRNEAPKCDKPWVLFVSLVCPHFPLVAPQQFYDLYPPEGLPLPDRRDGAAHPFYEAMRHCMPYDEFFPDDATRRRALANYYGMVSFVDHNVGEILAAIEANNIGDTTRVIYTSDHGDNLGTRSLWGKSTMYDESAGVPLLMAGPDVARGKVCRTPVTLVDAYPTILECVGEPATEEDNSRPGRSLFAIANGEHADRAVLSEYHAVGATTGAFMIRYGRWKYVHFVGLAAQLFDLVADPLETHDLAGDPKYGGVLRECEARLREICDPEAIDRLAFADQASVVARHGGREAVLRRGSFGHSPVPGEKAVYS
jgi:choline-sulfatase